MLSPFFQTLLLCPLIWLSPMGSRYYYRSMLIDCILFQINIHSALSSLNFKNLPQFHFSLPPQLHFQNKIWICLYQRTGLIAQQVYMSQKLIIVYCTLIDDIIHFKCVGIRNDKHQFDMCHLHLSFINWLGNIGYSTRSFFKCITSVLISECISLAHSPTSPKAQ